MEAAHGERGAKAARNQALWRHVNERIEALMETTANPEFICECARLDCTDTLRLSVAEYEAVRHWPSRFPVAPGHEVAGVERIVEANDRYVVVEKLGEAGELAAKLDPRSKNSAAS